MGVAASTTAAIPGVSILVARSVVLIPAGQELVKPPSSEEANSAAVKRMDGLAASCSKLRKGSIRGERNRHRNELLGLPLPPPPRLKGVLLSSARSAVARKNCFFAAAAAMWVESAA
jgi:hypothetical protein